MKKRWFHVTGVLAVTLVGALVVPTTALAQASDKGGGDGGYEVWIVDQADGAPRPDGSARGAGFLYIYDGNDLQSQLGSAVPEVVDLNGQVSDLCLAKTGARPVRGHMGRFNTGETHFVLAFVLSGHVTVINSQTRLAESCVRLPARNGQQQAHAAYTAPDNSYIVSAGQNQKDLVRLKVDFPGKTLVIDDIMNLDVGTTPTGAPKQAAGVRPDNAPICPIVDDSSRYIFTTLRGGGLFVVDGTTTPMKIVAEYDVSWVEGNGCGGIQVGDTMFIDSGGGTAAIPFNGELYAFSVSAVDAAPAGGHAANQPAPQHVFSVLSTRTDLHGSAVSKRANNRFVWVTDRAANNVEVIDTRTTPPTHANSFSLASAEFPDPAPDLIDIAPNGQLAFVALRGACPTTANAPGGPETPHNNAVGSTPGLGIIRIQGNGISGEMIDVAPITNPAPAGFNCPTRVDDVSGQITNRADPHGARVHRKNRAKKDR
jgi:hypothetical protein